MASRANPQPSKCSSLLLVAQHHLQVCSIGEKQISFAILQTMSVKVGRGEYMAMMECENLRSCNYVAIEE
uniref:Uncharacterized protein n=1 Tax=Populus trichocarpa TaxID=3694 RepID=A0A2K1WNS0_POPTR